MLAFTCNMILRRLQDKCKQPDLLVFICNYGAVFTMTRSLVFIDNDSLTQVFPRSVFPFGN